MTYRFILCFWAFCYFAVIRSNVIYEVRPHGQGIHSLQGAKADIDKRIMGCEEGDYIVMLDDGVYVLNEPLTFISLNNSTSRYSITFKAKEGSHPVISGSILPNKIIWKEDESNRRIAKTKVDIDVRNLWIDNKRMERSHGFVGYSDGIFEYTLNGKDLKGLLFKKETFPVYNDISGLEIKYFKFWRSYYFKVDNIYDCNNIQAIPENQVFVAIKNFDVALTQTPQMNWIDSGESNPYYFENIYELIDEPGEWCYQPSDSTLFYYLRDGEDFSNINAFIPQLENIVSVSGSNETVVENVCFNGLEFSHCYWAFPSEYSFIDHQGSAYYPGIRSRDIIPAAVLVENAKNVRFENCKFTELSSNGIWVKNNADNVYVENCEFKDISGAALSMSDHNHKAYSDTILPVKNITIKNNLFKEIGVEFASCPVIEAFYVEDLTVSNNELYRCPYSGISVGWGWTMDPISQKNIKIINNKIIGDTQKCSDGGAIYSLSNFGGEGLTIEGNYIDEITYKPIESSQGAVYTDQGSSNVRINNNVILSDRKWFFYHQPGKVEVDTVYVNLDNHENYGGIDAIQGGTEVKYIGDGAHILNYPHELADIIINNSGIKNNNTDTPSNIDKIQDNRKNDFIIKIVDGEVMLIPLCDFDSNESLTINIYGIEGHFKRSIVTKPNSTIPLEGVSRGFHIIEIRHSQRRWIYRVIV